MMIDTWLRRLPAMGAPACMAAASMVALLCTAPPTWAAVSAYSTGADMGFNKGDVTGAHIFDFGVLDHTSTLLNGALHFESSGTPAPSMRATAEIGPVAIDNVNGFVGGLLGYHVQITGAAGSVPVLIDSSGHAGGVASDGAAFQVKTYWALRDVSGLDLVSDTIETLMFGGSFDESFGHTTEVTLMANTDYFVFMSVDARAFAQLPGSHAFAESFVDPIFRFGAGVDPSLYAFEFSAGIGNERPVSVPEPPAHSIAALGLGLLAAVTRKRRR
jgi:MYXO-CTERM domain-containing protein